jgi:hypothetical protein
MIPHMLGKGVHKRSRTYGSGDFDRPADSKVRGRFARRTPYGQRQVAPRIVAEVLHLGAARAGAARGDSGEAADRTALRLDGRRRVGARRGGVGEPEPHLVDLQVLLDMPVGTSARAGAATRKPATRDRTPRQIARAFRTIETYPAVAEVQAARRKVGSL